MMIGSPTVKRVVNGQLCAGCGLCASLAPDAITMETVAPGYARPRQHGPVSEAAERAIAGTCPGSVVRPWPASQPIHPYWGPYRQVATGHATDENVRFQGSSGGALSALAIHALASGLVDRVIHVAPDPDQPTRNLIVCSRTEGEVIAGAGSRYAPSSPLAQIDDALSEGGSMAFIGKPCDVSALRALALHDPRVGRHVPVLLSFFCGGLPSHAGADRVLAAMHVDKNDVVAFRYRGQGWPGKAAAQTRDGAVAEMSYAQSWGDYLSKEIQFRCKICPDAVGGAADVACADAWYGGESGYPSFDEQDGRSLVMARTEAGQALVASAIAAGAIAIEPLAIDEIDLMQPAQARRKRAVKARLAALAATLQPAPAMSGVGVDEASRLAAPKEAAKNFFGTVRRILIGRR